MILDVVAALIKKNDGTFLIAQRGVNERFSGLWEFPGGKVEQDEDNISAIKREIKEELLVDIKVFDLLHSWIYDYDFGKIKLYVYDAEIIGNKEPEALEHMDLKWIKNSDLRDYDFVPADMEFINKMMED